MGVAERFLHFFEKKNNHFNAIWMDDIFHVFKAISKSWITRFGSFKEFFSLSPISTRTLTGQVQNTFKSWKVAFLAEIF